MAAPFLVQSLRVANTPSSTSMSATYGSATTAGNLLIATFYGNASSTAGWATPSGFSVGQNTFNGSAGGVFYKIADGTETSVASTITGSTNSQESIYEFGGGWGALDGNNKAHTASTVSSLTTSITLTGTDELVFAFMEVTGGQAAANNNWNSTTGVTLTKVQDGANSFSGWGSATSTSVTVQANWGAASNQGNLIALSFKQVSGNFMFVLR